jgi:hypothetical protein
MLALATNKDGGRSLVTDKISRNVLSSVAAPGAPCRTGLYVFLDTVLPRAMPNCRRCCCISCLRRHVEQTVDHDAMIERYMVYMSKLSRSSQTAKGGEKKRTKILSDCRVNSASDLL